MMLVAAERLLLPPQVQHSGPELINFELMPHAAAAHRHFAEPNRPFFQSLPTPENRDFVPFFH